MCIFMNTYMHIHIINIYIYIYMCVRACVLSYIKYAISCINVSHLDTSHLISDRSPAPALPLLAAP